MSGGRFKFESDGGFFEAWKELREGSEIKPGETIRITFNGQSPNQGETAAILLEVVKMGEVKGRIIII